MESRQGRIQGPPEKRVLQVHGSHLQSLQKGGHRRIGPAINRKLKYYFTYKGLIIVIVTYYELKKDEYDEKHSRADGCEDNYE